MTATINIEKDQKDVTYLVARLEKECSNSKGYLGVEYDNLEVDEDCPTYTESLFHKIMMEMNILNGNAEEYTEDGFDGEDAPFKTNKNVAQHVKRLCKFTEKYAPKYLREEDAARFIKEAKGY